MLKHDDVIGHPFDFVEQVRREQNGPALLGHDANDRLQNISANHRVQTRTGFVQNQQFRPVRQGRQQTDLGLLPLR